MTRIAILDDYQKVALASADWGRLPEGCRIEVFDRPLGGEDAVSAALAGFEVAVAMRERTPFPESLLKRLPALRLLVTTGMRNAAIDVAAAARQGIVVAGTGMSGYAAAEHAWALVLGLTKHIAREDRAMREGGWQAAINVGLNGKTLGLLGLGRLGRRVARMGQAFEMPVIAWSQNLTAEACAAAGVEHVARDELFRRSDVLSIHLVLSRRTRGLVGARELALMKPTAYLVNTSRGPIVDEAALIAVLAERRIAGAGLDVYDVEPLPAGHPLRRLDNTVLTGHTGYVIGEGYRVAYADAVEDIAAWLAGKPVRVLAPA